MPDQGDPTDAVPNGLPDDAEDTFNPDRPHLEDDSIGRTSPTFHWELLQAGEKPPVDVPATPAPASLDEHSSGVSGFQLRRRVGQGGCGEVWEATQVSLQRRVAIKRIRRDLLDVYGPTDSERGLLLRSFRNEALTAANLEHPNIIPVHELSSDPDTGEPVLAMKLARGKPWNVALKEDFRTLSVDEHLFKHLPILMGVAQAAAFAHSKGVLHRDIKPAQVIVGEFGEVVLVDWGLAIPFSGGESGRGIDPEFASAISPLPEDVSNPAGTSAYMAPEQTDVDSRRLGPWTDVYLLGGTLYYILTGRPPHQGNNRKEVYLRAMRGVVRPAAESAPGRAMPGELLELAMEALHHDPEERIRSASEFIVRLRDCLSGASRRRESVALTKDASIRLDHAKGDYRELGDCAAQAVRARLMWPDNPTAAELRERVLTEFARAALANDDLVLAQIQAERKENEGERRALLTEVEAANSRARRRETVRRSALAGVAVLALVVIAGSLFFNRRLSDQVARTEAALGKSGKARADAEELIGFMIGDLRTKLSTAAGGEILKEVGVKAENYFSSIPVGELTPEMRVKRATSILQISELLQDQGRLEESSKLVEEVFAEADTLVKEYPRTADILVLLGETWRRRGLLRVKTVGETEAIECFKTSLPYWEEASALRPDDKNILANVTLLYDEIAESSLYLDDTETAMKLFSRARDIRKATAAADPEDYPWRRAYAESLRRVAKVHAALSDYDLATEGFVESIALMEKLAAERPADIQVRRELANGYLFYGAMEFSQRRKLAEAETAFRSAAKVYEGLILRDPADLENRSDYAIATARVADVAAARGDMEATLELYQTSVSTFEKVVEAAPDNIEYLNSFAVSKSRLSQAYESIGDLATAARLMEEQVEILRSIFAKAPDDAEVIDDLATALIQMGDSYADRDLYQEAIREYEEGAALAKGLADRSPELFERRRFYNLFLSRIAKGFEKAGNPDRALEIQRESLDYAMQIVADMPNNPNAKYNQAGTMQQVSSALERVGQVPEALELLDDSVVVLRQIVGGKDSGPTYEFLLAGNLFEAARLRLGMNELGRAESDARESATLFSTLLQGRAADTRWEKDYADSLAVLGRILAKRGDLEGAIEIAKRREAKVLELLGRHPAVRPAKMDVADARIDLARVFIQAARCEEAEASANEALALVVEILDGSPEYVPAMRFGGIIYAIFGDCAATRGDVDAAAAARAKGLEYLDKVPAQHRDAKYDAARKGLLGDE
jgi:serine/threonine protein kinase